MDEEKVKVMLAEIWELIEYLAEETGIPVVANTVAGDGLYGYQVAPNAWRVTAKASWGRCRRCGTVTSHPAIGVCPMYRCGGVVEPVDPHVELRDHHYRRLYYRPEITPMRVEEHTAQLTSQAATQLQKRFEDGEVNVLSCSTTFEMGVDVGELEAVVLHNVPPEAANYIQRAGRAGRRSSSTAFTLTYAQRRSHDLAFYAKPEQMVAGSIRPRVSVWRMKR